MAMLRTILAISLIVTASSFASAQTDKDIREIYSIVTRRLLSNQKAEDRRQLEFAAAWNRSLARDEIIYALATSELDDEVGIQIDKPTVGLDERLRRANQSSIDLSRYIKSGIVVFIRNEDFEDLERQSLRAWEATVAARLPSKVQPPPEYCSHSLDLFFEGRPQASGIYRISRVGFDTKKNRAVVAAVRSGACGADHFIFTLSKRGGQWAILSSRGGSWVS
ncbi:MAG: hypothetical protein ABL959_17005 [Pyrinomonadaceae bacterium]